MSDYGRRLTDSGNKMIEEAHLIDPKHTRRDLLQLESAVRKGWKIPDAIFAQTASVLGSIVAKGKTREKIAAARVLVAMNEQNGKPDGPTPQVHLHKHEHGDAGGQSEEQDIERWRQSIRQRAGVIERAGGNA